jgi:UDP-N-acetylmuramate--alanine ligase
MDLFCRRCGLLIRRGGVYLMTHVHLIGIGGSGLSAIARLLLEQGYTVSGSDLEFSALAQEVQELGAHVSLGHRAEQVAGADLVIRSSAIPEDNAEVQAAKAAGIPVYKRSDYLGKLIDDRMGIAVAGTHGKTTTTAMISWMLSALDQDPSYIIGGVTKNLGKNAHAGTGQVFVIEADEYDYMFLGLRPQIAIVTNIEHDHPDCFPTEKDFFKAFIAFVQRIPKQGILLACVDDDGAARLLDVANRLGCKHYSYGLGTQKDQGSTDYSVQNLTLTESGFYEFEVLHRGAPLETISLNVPGIHNVRNALAAFAVAHQLGLPVDATAQALSEFQGTSRRFELRGEVSGITVIDDYAHHPTEIRVTLSAARDRFPDRKLWAVWQPHTYSRTEALFNEFLTAFKDADHVLVTEIYASREPIKQEFSSQQVVQSMDHPDVHFLPSKELVTDYLVSNLNRGDVVMVLSAGDANRISENVIDLLSVNGNANHG